MKATEIFTPGSLPTHTYNDRAELNLEFRLLEAIETHGMIASVSGPSKSGKTVLCESVIGKRGRVLLAGGGIDREEVFWTRLRKRLGMAAGRTESSAASRAVELGGQAKGGLSIPFVAKGEVSVSPKVATTSSTADQTAYDGPDGVELLEHLRDLKRTLVVDDFHYIDKDVRRSLAQQFKEAARSGTSIVLVSVSSRADDAIRANPDLRGRLVCLDIPYWQPHELQRIPDLGFPLLNVLLPGSSASHLAEESVSSPQLMQAMCLQLCRQLRVDEALDTPTPISLSSVQEDELFRATTAFTNCETAFDVLLTGPKPRGLERTVYTLKGGDRGDVYFLVLKALTLNPPALSYDYDAIKKRVAALVDDEAPRGSSLTSTLAQMHKLVIEALGDDRVLDWDEEKEVLTLPDPYFLFYLRWTQWGGNV